MTKLNSQKIAQGRSDAVGLANLIGESINVHSDGQLSAVGSTLAAELFSAGLRVIETIRPEAHTGRPA